jgi:hypothetical protein
LKSNPHRSAANKTEALEVEYAPQCCKQNVLAKTNNLKLPTLLPFAEFNTTMALAIMTERDFVDAGVGQRCRCETAQGDQHRDYGLLV